MLATKLQCATGGRHNIRYRGTSAHRLVIDDDQRDTVISFLRSDTETGKN